MTNLRKKTILVVLSAILVLSMIMCLMGRKDTYALSPKDIISSQSGVDIVLDALAPNSIDGELKGVKITANGNSGSINFNGNKGPFSLKLRALSAAEGVSDISEIRFEFINKNYEKESFSAIFSDKLTNNVRKVHTSVFYKDVENLYTLFTYSSNKNGGDVSHLSLKDTSFVGEGNPLEVSFNPFDMKFSFGNGVKTNEIVDFDNPDSMKKNFGNRTPLSRIDEYDVKMTIFSANENPASVILYEYNGQSLAGQEIVNNVGPVVDARINNTKGVKGYSYDLNLANVNMYDVIDGYTAFGGEVKIVAPNGSTVVHNKGVFTPEFAGTYSVSYTPIDSSEEKGETYVQKINVLDKYPDALFDFHYDITSDLVFNNKVTLPWAKFTSELAGDYDKEITVSAKIFANGSVIHEQNDASADFVVDVSGKTDLSVRYYALDYLGNEKTSLTYKIKNNGASAEIKSVNAEMLLGSYIYADKAFMGGNSLKHEIISPLGSISTYERVKLDTIGQWKVNYYYTLNDTEYTYTQYVDCVEVPSSLFITSRGMTISDYVSSPDYSDLDVTGLMAESTTSYAALTYKNNINVSSYTLNDKLLEFLFTPEVKGSNEIKEAAVILADPYNSNNDITIKFQLEPYFSYTNLVAEIHVGENVMKLDNGKPRKFYLGHSTFFGKYYGSNTTSKFSNSVNISLDYESKTLYIYNDFETTGYNYVSGYDANDKAINSTHIGIDLDNETMLGKGNAWKGFTTGETQLQFVYTKLTQTAHTLVLAVDNMDLSGKIVQDTSAPGLVVNCDYDNLPTAKVNQAFPLMSAYAIDSIDGRIDDVNISVYKITNSVNRKVEVSISKTFTPTSVGTYKIVYRAKDSSGNIGTKEIYIEALEELPALDVDIDVENSYASELRQGERFALVSTLGKGGSGEVTVDISVLCNGQPVDVDGVYVLAEKVGHYQVIYTLKDYLGNEQKIIKNITVERSDSPVFSDVMIPQAVIAGRKFTVPERTANWYDAQGEKHTAVATVKINGQDYTGKTYTPTADFTLQYFANGYGSETVVVKALVLEKSKPHYLTGYYSMGDGVSVDKINTSNSYLTFTVVQDSNIFFGNMLGAENVRVKFMLDNTTNSIGKVNFVFTDSINPDEKVVITTERNADATKETAIVTINGTKQYDLEGCNYTAISPYGVDIGIKGNKAIGANGVEIATIETTLDGAEFNGFSSGRVYLDIQFVDVESSSEFYIKSINNQSMTIGVDADKTAPEIVLYEEFVPTAEHGKVYKFADMQVFDTLDDTVTTYLKITAPSGEMLFNDIMPIENYQFTPEEYGMYTVLIEFHDTNNKWNFYSNTIMVRNTNIPELTYSDDVDTEFDVGDSIDLPDVIVEEGIMLYASIMAPTGIETNLYTSKVDVETGEITITRCADEYKFETAGVYKLTYYASNNDGAYKLDVFTITVK